MPTEDAAALAAAKGAALAAVTAAASPATASEQPVKSAAAPRAAEAPIKAEFRVAVVASSATAVPVVGAKRTATDAEAADAGEEAPSAPGQARPKARGMNKGRKHFKPDANEVKLCGSVLKGTTCNFGERCKFSHDLAAYMAQRPADLGETCPIYTLRGFCRFGAACRFGSSHLDPSAGSNMTTPVATPPCEEMNVVPFELTQRLRKKAIDFTAIDARSDAIMKDVQRQHDAHQAGRQAEFGVMGEGSGEGGGERSVGKADGEGEGAANGDGAEGGADVPPSGGGEPSSYHARAASSDAVPKRERKHVDFRGKLYLAPLTTVGNLPFRRVCKGLGADITCGEMALGTSLLQGHASEWALLKRHPCEDFFGVQIAGNNAQPMGRVAQLIEENCDVDFVDINMGCPIDAVCNKGMGASLACRPGRVQSVVRTMSERLSCPLTVKMRIGYDDGSPTAHKLIPRLATWGAAAVTLHGRTRQQRYYRSADWEYINTCAGIAQQQPLARPPAASDGGEPPNGFLPLIGNGDVFSYEDVHAAMLRASGVDAGAGADDAEAADGSPSAGALATSPLGGVSSVMLARGALVKPWAFTEIKERRHWDISATERLDILKQFTSYGLEHWGTDDLGVARVRKFLLEWLSFLHRYVPIGLLERLPGRLQDRPPAFVGRNDLETLMASPNANDWVRITEMLLGPVPTGFTFMPKHKANSYESGPIQSEG